MAAANESAPVDGLSASSAAILARVLQGSSLAGPRDEPGASAGPAEVPSNGHSYSTVGTTSSPVAGRMRLPSLAYGYNTVAGTTSEPFEPAAVPVPMYNSMNSTVAGLVKRMSVVGGISPSAVAGRMGRRSIIGFIPLPGLGLPTMDEGQAQSEEGAGHGPSAGEGQSPRSDGVARAGAILDGGATQASSTKETDETCDVGLTTLVAAPAPPPPPPPPPSAPRPFKPTASPALGTPRRDVMSPAPAVLPAPPPPPLASRDVSALPTPRDVTVDPTPRDVTAAPTPRDVSVLPTPRNVTAAPIPRDVTAAPTPRDASALPTPRNVTAATIPRDVTAAPTPRDVSALPTPLDVTASAVTSATAPSCPPPLAGRDVSAAPGKHDVTAPVVAPTPPSSPSNLAPCAVTAAPAPKSPVTLPMPRDVSTAPAVLRDVTTAPAPAPRDFTATPSTSRDVTAAPSTSRDVTAARSSPVTLPTPQELPATSRDVTSGSLAGKPQVRLAAPRDVAPPSPMRDVATLDPAAGVTRPQVSPARPGVRRDADTDSQHDVAAAEPVTRLEHVTFTTRPHVSSRDRHEPDSDAPEPVRDSSMPDPALCLARWLSAALLFDKSAATMLSHRWMVCDRKRFFKVVWRRTLLLSPAFVVTMLLLSTGVWTYIHELGHALSYQVIKNRRAGAPFPSIWVSAFDNFNYMVQSPGLGTFLRWLSNSHNTSPDPANCNANCYGLTTYPPSPTHSDSDFNALGVGLGVYGRLAWRSIAGTFPGYVLYTFLGCLGVVLSAIATSSSTLRSPGLMGWPRAVYVSLVSQYLVLSSAIYYACNYSTIVGSSDLSSFAVGVSSSGAVASNVNVAALTVFAYVVAMPSCLFMTRVATATAPGVTARRPWSVPKHVALSRLLSRLVLRSESDRDVTRHEAYVALNRHADDPELQRLANKKLPCPRFSLLWRFSVLPAELVDLKNSSASIQERRRKVREHGKKEWRCVAVVVRDLAEALPSWRIDQERVQILDRYVPEEEHLRHQGRRESRSSSLSDSDSDPDPDRLGGEGAEAEAGPRPKPRAKPAGKTATAWVRGLRLNIGTQAQKEKAFMAKARVEGEKKGGAGPTGGWRGLVALLLARGRGRSRSGGESAVGALLDRVPLSQHARFATRALRATLSLLACALSVVSPLQEISGYNSRRAATHSLAIVSLLGSFLVCLFLALAHHLDRVRLRRSIHDPTADQPKRRDVSSDSWEYLRVPYVHETALYASSELTLGVFHVVCMPRGMFPATCLILLCGGVLSAVLRLLASRYATKRIVEGEREYRKEIARDVNARLGGDHEFTSAASTVTSLVRGAAHHVSRASMAVAGAVRRMSTMAGHTVMSHVTRRDSHVTSRPTASQRGSVLASAKMSPAEATLAPGTGAGVATRKLDESGRGALGVPNPTDQRTNRASGLGQTGLGPGTKGTDAGAVGSQGRSLGRSVDLSPAAAALRRVSRVGVGVGVGVGVAVRGPSSSLGLLEEDEEGDGANPEQEVWAPTPRPGLASK